MKRLGAFPLYALGSGVIIALVATLYSLFYDGGATRQAVWVSAAVAFTIQVAAFAIALNFARAGQAIAGWGIGALISMATLVGFGFVARAVGLPVNAALLSLATFLFLTELIEPPLLNR